MKYPESMYTQTISEGRYQFKPVSGEDPTNGKLITMYFGPTIHCKSNQDVFAAAKEHFGEDTFVDIFDTNAFAPKLENVEQYGDPIGAVRVHAHDPAYYVYRR